MFQEEAVALLQQHEGTFLWQEGLLQLFRYIEQNRAVCLCALKSVGREHLKRFFEADIHAIIHRAVEEVGRGGRRGARGCTGQRKSKTVAQGAPQRELRGAFFAEKADSVLDKRKGTGYNKHMIKI